MLNRPMPKTIVAKQVDPFFQMLGQLYKTMNIHMENHPDDIPNVRDLNAR